MMRLSLRSQSWVVVCLGIWSLSGCSISQSLLAPTQTPALNVTQAYETIEARLTQALATISPATATPSPTSPSSVPASGSPSPRPVETIAAATPTSGLPASPTFITQPTLSCDRAAAGIPIDVTIPDDTQLSPEQSFTKIWRLQNTGSCTWTKEYQVALFSGEAMGAPQNLLLTREVSPGQSIDISIDMVAPRQAGRYQGNWKLKNGEDQWFGIGPNGEASFWVRIVVVPTASPTSTQGAPEPTPTLTPVVQVSGQVLLSLDNGLDLDTLQLNPESGSDLVYRVDESGQFHLAPQEGFGYSIFGSFQPELQDCRSASMVSEPLQLGELPLGTYLCYRTNLGLPGWMKFLDLNPNVFTLTLDVSTWNLP